MTNRDNERDQQKPQEVEKPKPEPPPSRLLKEDKDERKKKDR